MATTREPLDVKVGFCGRAAHVELKAEEGLNELRARVADAFGLTAPFELISPEGVPMRSVLDPSLAQTGGVCPEVSVDASEDALLDLERAHEETGAIRMMMLRKVLADLRRQLADVYAGIADLRHQSAVLDEKLLRERSLRESGTAAVQADLKCISQRMGEESNRIRNEGRDALEAAVLDLKTSISESICELQAKITDDVVGLKNAVHSEKEERCAALTSISQDVGSVRSSIEQEAEMRATCLKLTSDDIEALKSLLQSERQERAELKDKLEMQNAELGVRLTQEQSNREQDVHSIRHSITEVVDSQKVEARKHSEALDLLTKQLEESSAASEAKLVAQQTLLEGRLASIEGKMQTALEHEGQHRELRLSSIAKSIEDLDVSRRSWEAGWKDAETALHKNIADVAQCADEHRRKLEEDVARYRVVEYAALVERLRDEEQNRIAEAERTNASFRSLQEAMEKTNQFIRDTCAAASSENDKKREDDMGEMKRLYSASAEEQRKWVNDLIEHQGKAAKAANEALITEARARGEELGREAAERVRSDIMAEVTRIETSAAELIKAQDDSRKSDLEQQQVHAQKTASDLKDCLTSHSEFMEALASEQQLLIKRLTEGFAMEGSKREDLTVRVHGLQSDMQKVKGHLPILFVPTGFAQR